MVALGVGAETVEIIDLQSINSTCAMFSRFPKKDNGAVGGLGPDEKPIVCGGGEAGDYSNECYFYVNKTWSSFPSMSERRYYSAISQSPYPDKSHFFLVTGGFSDIGYPSNTGEVLTQNGWLKVSVNLPTVMARHCVVLVNDTTVMLIGGRKSQDGFLKETYLFNSENEIWSEGPTLMSKRDSHTCAKIKKSRQSSQYSIIVAGGYNGGEMSSVEILEEGASEWAAKVSDMNTLVDSLCFNVLLCSK